MRVVFLAFCCLGFSAVCEALPAQQQPLVQSNNLTYLGAFRSPDTAVPGSQYGFSYAQTGFAFNPANNSLFLNTHIYEQKTAELNIPALSTNLASLATASIRQNPADVTEGNLHNLLAGGAPEGASVTMGGLFVYNNKLVGSAYIYYDANQNARLSHFTHSLNVSQTGSFRGMYQVGTLNPGFYAGTMASVPAEWQPLLGGPAITGLGSIAIIGRSSSGPAAFVFDPDRLGSTTPVPATPLVYYDLNHATLGTWDNVTVAGNDFNMGSAVTGVAFPGGTRSVLFFGRQGLGVPCYGEGGATSPPGAVHWCYDPELPSKGGHAYPYKYWVWAYDAVDLLAVKDGQRTPWSVAPYARWELPLPLQVNGHELGGVAYDSQAQKIYVLQLYAGGSIPGGSTYDRTPIIHAFSINNSTPPPRCDANGDGSTNVVDVQLGISMAMGIAPCTADINLDGQCSVVDVQRIVNAAVNGICVSP